MKYSLCCCIVPCYKCTKNKMPSQTNNKIVQFSIDHRHSCICMNIDGLVEMLDTKLSILSFLLDLRYSLAIIFRFLSHQQHDWMAKGRGCMGGIFPNNLSIWFLYVKHVHYSFNGFYWPFLVEYGMTTTSIKSIVQQVNFVQLMESR